MATMQPAPPVGGTPARRQRAPAPRGRRVGEPLPPLAAPPRAAPTVAAAPPPASQRSSSERPSAGLLVDAQPLEPPVATRPLPSVPGAVGGAAPAATAARHVGGETGSSKFTRAVTGRFMIESDTGMSEAAARYMQASTKGNQAQRIEFVRLVRSATRIQSRWRGLAARRLWMTMKRTVENMSWVLVCTVEGKSGQPSPQTLELIRRLQSKPLQIMHFASPDRKRYYIAVSANDEDLVVPAEEMRLRMFLKPKKIYNPLDGTEVEIGAPDWFGGTCEYIDSARHEFIPASQLPLYIAGTPPGEDEVPTPQEDGGPSFFDSGERQRLTRYIIEQMGDRIDMEDAVERYNHKDTTRQQAKLESPTPNVVADILSQEITCVREFFPLHNDHEMITLYAKWASLSLVGKHFKDALVELAHLRLRRCIVELNKLVDQPLHLIRNYYGERIALYYAYVGAYTRCLMLPMVLGVMCQAEYWFGGGYWNFGGIEGNWTGIVYSLLMSLWSVYFLSVWTRTESELRFVWGTEQFVSNDDTLYAFSQNEENPYKFNPLTNTNERAYGSRWKRLIKFVPTTMFVLVCIAGVALAGLVAIYVKTLGATWNAIGSMGNFLSIVLFQSLYNIVSERLNDWENWQTRDEWEDSFIKKLFLFQFVNNFFFLFFIAYFKYTTVFGSEGSCKYEPTKGRDSCMQELELNMVIVFALKTWGQQIVEVSLPFVKAWARHNLVACGRRCGRWQRICLRTRDSARRISLLEGTGLHSSPGTNITFAPLDAEEKEEVMDELTVHKFKPGQYIVEQDDVVTDEDPALYIMSEGFATVIVDGIERPVTLSVGQNFGERSLLMREPRTATIMAVEHCTVLGLSRQNYKRLGLSRLKWKSADYKDLNKQSDKSIDLGIRTIQSALTTAVISKVESEYKLESYDDLDAFKDFNEMVIQFGYITLFAVALPIAPLLAVLNNFFEIRGDAFALCKGNRRRAYQTKRSIGSWFTVLEILSMTAVITNALLTGFVNSTVADLDPLVDESLYATQTERMSEYRLWMWVFIFEHLMLLARTVLQQVVGSEEEWIHLQRELVKKRVKENIKNKGGTMRKRRTSQTGGVIDAFVTQLKKKSNSEEHKFSIDHCTIVVKNIPRHMATEKTVERVFGVQGTVLATTVRVREGRASSWALVTFTESPPVFQAVQKGASGVFSKPLFGVDHAALLALVLEKADMNQAAISTGAFGLMWRQQADKVDEAYVKFQQGYSTKTLRATLQANRAAISLRGGFPSIKWNGAVDDAVEAAGAPAGGTESEDDAMGLISRLNAIKAGGIMLPVDQTPQGKRGAKADDEQIRPPMSAAVSPTGTPVPLTPQTPATATQQHPQALAPAVTPAREEPLEAIFARLDVSNDGQLDKTEVGQMLALLRAQATDAFADEEWLQPSAQETATAMREMDRDRSGSVSFAEFKDWWTRRNHDGEFAASPAMWGLLDMSDEEDEEEQQQWMSAPTGSSSNDHASTSLLPPIPGAAPAPTGSPSSSGVPADAVVIDVASPPAQQSEGRAVSDAAPGDDDSVVDEEEHQEVVSLFRQVDANGDGALQASEISRLIVLIRAKATDSSATDEADWLAPSADEVSKAMEFMDLDGNGTVSLEEFLEWWEVKGGWDYAGDPAEWD
jgi:Ca2+-binding EF-hand superfamily protein